MNEPEASMENECPQCDAAVPLENVPFQPPGIKEVSRLFPQLEILSLIGEGDMGAAYRARQLALDQIVVLIILPPEAATGSGFVEPFNREARAPAAFNHPNLVAVYEFGHAGGLPYIIMEWP